MDTSRRQFLQAAAVTAGAMSIPGPLARAEEAAAPKRIRQSACFGPFSRKLGPERLIAAAKEIGFESIEMGPRQHWQAIRDAGLTVAIVGGHGSLRDGLNNPENHDRIEKELLANIAVAKENGIPSLICFSGNRNGRSEEEGLENCAKGIRRVIKAAEDNGITLCMELLNSKVNHPDYQCDHTAWGVELCKRVDSPAMKLLYDIYHMQIMEGDLIRTIRDSIAHIGHFHTAGNPGRKDPDDTQEIYYPAVMRAIAETGYAGFVGHEFGPKGDPLEAMKAAYATCNVTV